MSLALRIYHRLPYPLKRLAAAREGRRLLRWRIGPDFEARVAAAAERDTWTAAQWAEETRDAQAAFLERAARHVPAYRDRDPGADRHTLARWPVLRKADLRAASDRFLADDRPVASLFRIRTSGTTGTPLQLFWSRETCRAWAALYEARIRRWNGVRFGEPWCLFGGQLVTSVARRRPPFWVWNAPMQQLYASVYHLAADTAGAYVEALAAHEVRSVVGYPSALASLARFGLAQGLTPPALRVVVANAEPILAGQRAAIESFFGAPLRDTYGMAEAAAGASACEHGALHLWPEAGHVEVLDDDDLPVAPGTTGRLVLTGWLHDAMPLIRYDIGDRGALDPGTTPCPCGRTLPRIARIDGRADDLVITPDGREIGRLDPVFKDASGIREAQIEQRTRDALLVRVVPDGAFDASARADLVAALQDRVGALRIDLDVVAEIPRGPRGKFRAVISRLDGSYQ